MNYPIKMYEYHVWANQTLLARVNDLSSDLLIEEVNSSFPTIPQAFSHIYAVDYMWLRVLKGIGMQEALEASYPLVEETKGYSVEEFVSAFEQLAKQYNEWIQKEEDLEKTIMIENPFAGNIHTTFSDILLHVANHGTYHRGNVSTMLRQLGHASTMTDYMLFWYQDSAKNN